MRTSPVTRPVGRFFPSADALQDGLVSYYGDRHVRSRLVEFLGGPSAEEASAMFITASARWAAPTFAPLLPSALRACLREGHDVGRSLWDRRHLLIDLDLEYIHFDDPTAVYLRPERPLSLQRPFVRALLAILGEHGIRPLHLLSGRGHHLLWTVQKRSGAAEELARIGRVDASLRRAYRCPHPPAGDAVQPEDGAAFAGIALIVEHLLHRLYEAAPGREVSLQPAAIEVGPGAHGRETVALDLTGYGNPLGTRSLRVPFSGYLKPQQDGIYLGRDVARHLPRLITLPANGLDDENVVRAAMREPEAAIEIAARAQVRIPDFSTETSGLIEAYLATPLARFHGHFYGESHAPRSSFAEVYDGPASRELVAPCVQAVLARPNPLLLKPAAIQKVVRAGLAAGWHPRRIAGLIRGRYLRDFGWGGLWTHYDAGYRADFWTRLFAGLVTLGHDALVDFNCRSEQEKGYCFESPCSHDLAGDRDALARANLARW